ncbi:death on curing protein [Geosmithia morbida]|uniref:Death on curing protein n=1 Tax=Geosmithia morbida TaxID=1094350 RepID=A0A9P5D1N7_9HYPO|nr:death on curing protein [Geosmithia morbida]KAF4120005.1 death on curing protein [Geosmithia morbida]
MSKGLAFLSSIQPSSNYWNLLLLLRKPTSTTPARMTSTSLAGILGEKTILNHAFQDGNKRTAIVSTDMFLKINGFKLQDAPSEEDEFDNGLTKAHISVVSHA